MSKDLPGSEACKFWGVGLRRRERRLTEKWVGVERGEEEDRRRKERMGKRMHLFMEPKTRAKTQLRLFLL